MEGGIGHGVARIESNSLPGDASGFQIGSKEGAKIHGKTSLAGPSMELRRENGGDLRPHFEAFRGNAGAANSPKVARIRSARQKGPNGITRQSASGAPPAAMGHHGARGRRIGHHDGPAVGDAHGGGFAAFQEERVSSSVIAPSQDPSPVDLLGATDRSCPSAVGGELGKKTLVARIERMTGMHSLAQGDKHASDLEEDLRRGSRRRGNQHQVRAAKRVRSSCRTFPGANRPSPASAASSIPATLSWRASRTTSARRSSSKSSPSSPSASVMPSV